MVRGNIEEGTVVMIMRTDGRMQPGVIKTVMRPKRIAVVEWDEQGERKGKVVTFNEIFALNAFKSPVDVEQPCDNKTPSGKAGNDSNTQTTKPSAAVPERKSTVNPRLPSPWRRKPMTAIKPRTQVGPSNIPPPPILRTRAGRNLIGRLSHRTTQDKNKCQRPTKSDVCPPSASSLSRKAATGAVATVCARQSLLKPILAIHSQASTSQDATNHSQASTSSVSFNHKQAGTSQDATIHKQAFTSSDSTNCVQAFTSSDSTNHKPAITSCVSTNRVPAIITATASSGMSAASLSKFHDVLQLSPSANISNKSRDKACEPRVLAIRNMERGREEQRKKNAKTRADNELLKSLNKNWELMQMMDNYRRSLEFNLLSADKMAAKKISVFIRKRPLSLLELSREEVDILTVANSSHIVAHELKQKVDGTKFITNHCFRFDHVFDVDCSNLFVYEKTAKPLVMTMLAGGRATCLAYGQTGTGKTHTMGGAAKSEEGGIYGLVAYDLFYYLQQPEFKMFDLEVVASYYEIYCTKIYDLLNRRTQLSILEDRTGKLKVCHVSETVVTSAEQVMKLLLKGNTARSSGKTSANENSSRSHAVLQLVLRSRVSRQQHGVFALIDLAGNERGSDNTSVEKRSKRETGEINKSLLILKECIRAMGQEGVRLPFRNSKLTHVLRDSFIGDNIQTCMIATVSPGNVSTEHSIDTLKYADRVKGLPVRDSIILGDEA